MGDEGFCLLLSTLLGLPANAFAVRPSRGTPTGLLPNFFRRSLPAGELPSDALGGSRLKRSSYNFFAQASVAASIIG